MLGPAEQEDPLQDPDAEPDVEWSPPRVTSAPSPAFKPSYTRPQLGPECFAKRKLDMGGGDASGLPPTATEKEKIWSLGDPYATNKVPEAQSETGQDRPLRCLSPEVSAPFFAAAMLDAGIPVHFPPDEGAEAGELGEAEKARVRKPIRPWIPMMQSLQGYVRELQQAGRHPPSEPDSHLTPLQTPHESHSAPRALQVQPPAAPAVHTDPQLKEDKEGATMVDSSTQSEARAAFFSSNAMFMPYYGCFQGGMGSSLGGYYVIGQMDPGYRQTPHQQAGSAETAPAGQRTNSQGTLRQSISDDVHQLTGRNTQQIAISPNSQAAHLLPAPRDTAPSRTSPRGGQQASRCSIQGGNRPSDTEKSQRDFSGMAAEQSSVPDSIQSAGETVHRPICDKGEQPATSLLHVGSGPHGLRSGCHDHQLEQDAGL